MSRRLATASIAVLIASAAYGVVGFGAFGQTPASADDWSTSLHDPQRTAASTDTSISPSGAPTLTRRWSFQTGGPVATTPTVTGGTAYFGSWDGYEYAVNTATGALQWKTYLGVTNAPSDCSPSGAIGVSSPATVSSGVVYVGGGDGYFYALNAATGAVAWRTWVSGSGSPGNYDGHYNWSGPLIVNGYAYVGVASEGDCPLIQGQLLQISLSTKNIVNTLNIVPNGQIGGGIWTSPAYDPSTNTIFADTGTQGNDTTQPWAQALLAIDAGSLAVKSSWKLPTSQAVDDSDFGTSTTLFGDANGNPLVAAINKNGIVYAFNRGNLAAGPVWQQQIAVGGDCATCGASSVSSGAFGNGTLFMAGNTGVINGMGYPGTVRAINPSTGSFQWQHAAPGSVIGALGYDNGMVFDGAGSYLEVLDATTGNRLYSYDTGSQIYAGPSVAGGVVYVGNTAGQVEAFSMPTSPPPPPPDAHCPGGFTCQDIGSPSPAGSETVNGGTWNISAGGAGIGGTTDSFRLMSEPTAGDAQVSARITAAPNGGGGAAGVMVRQNNAPGSPYYAVLAKPGNTLSVQYRTAFGGGTTVLTTPTGGGLPTYLMIQRVGDSFQAATSTDGATFTLVPGSNATLALPTASLAGLAVSSGSQGTSATASASAVSVGSPSVTLARPASPSPCPSAWTCGDIGNPAPVGDQSLSSGTWTVKGAGSGIGQSTGTPSRSVWPVDDQFHYAWQSLSGDGTISAHVTSQTNTSANAQAGVMLRAATSGGAAYYSAWVTPGNGVVVTYRTTAGLLDQTVASVTGSAPAWVEVARSGGTLTAYTSTNGTNWLPVTGSSVVMPNMQGTILAGLVVSSDVAGTLGTASFQSVNIANSAPPPPNLCPSGWTCSDIGFPTPAGNQSYSNGTWTVQGGGADIWDPTDAFRFISQSQATDGTVSARVASQSNTDPWAKSGVMIRVSPSNTSAYYGVFVTPGHGIVVQYRAAEGGTTSQIAIAGTAPAYLKINRSGATYTGYTSSDGVNWQAVAGSAVSLPALTGTLQAGIAVCSHKPSALSTVVFDTVTVTAGGGGGGGGGGGLPSPWAHQDVGGATPPGSASASGGTFTVQGGGSDIWGTADQFQYVDQPLSGDGTIVARVTAQSNSDPWAKAGIMIKQSTTAGSPYALLAVTPGNGVAFQYGFNTGVGGGSYTFPNGWLKLTRAGNTFTAYKSADGSTWTQVGTATITMASGATVGLFVSSHNSGTLSTATFDNVTVTAGGGGGGGGGGGLPSPWAHQDVGGATPPGSASASGGTFTVQGGGSDIWGTADQFQYVDQPLSGDGTIVARVTAQSNSDPWAKAGIMIKQSTTAGSPYALLAVTPGNGVAFQYGFNTGVGGGSYTFPNGWLKLTRAGNTFTAYKSADGSTWTQVGTATITMASGATVGLFVSSHNSGTLSTATFDNVTVTAGGGGGGGGGLPSPWAHQDVGGATPPGSASASGGTFTVQGGGSDIWGTADQFQYVDQPLSGDGTIVARVTAQSNSDPWAKAGIMIKQSTTAGSPYALLAVTPGNGVAFQYGFNTGVGGGSYTFPNGWLKLTRAGNTFTAYKSADGSTWTQVGTATITMASGATVGLFVSSHNSGTLSTATFDNVTVS